MCFFNIHRGLPFRKRVALCSPPLSWRVLLAPLHLSLLPRVEGQLGVTSSQSHAALGSPRKALAPLGYTQYTGHWEQRLCGWQLSVKKIKVSQAQPGLQ